jgi:choline dehydrogenase-like flavoprotein
LLTESVLVVEYGGLESNPDILLPAIGLTDFPADMYNYTSIPQPGMANQTAVLRAGALVGGGSAVNSMYFDRGSAEDYDSWEKLGNPGWGWKGMLPYFQKASLSSPLWLLRL